MGIDFRDLLVRLKNVAPSNVRHSVKALTDGRAIIVDYPQRRDIEQTRS